MVVINMNCVSWILVLIFVTVHAKFHSTKIDYKELKCLVCKTAIKEFNDEIAKIDPNQMETVGRYHIDAKEQKQVLKIKSETFLSELASTICDKMDNYIRGTWKDDGTLTLLKLIDNNQMNTNFGLIDIIQDDDLNKSLKYYCEELIEENDDNIIKQYQEDTENIAEEICMNQAVYCTPNDFIEVEHVAPPGSENDFASQFGLNKDFNAGESAETIDDDTTPALDENADIGVDDLKDEL